MPFKLALSPCLLPAALLLAGAAATGIIALTTARWSVGSAPGDKSHIGLWSFCLRGAVIPGVPSIVPLPCGELNHNSGVALLTLLGDDDPEGHWSLFAAARICALIGVCFTGLAFGLSVAFALYLHSRALLMLPILAAVAAIALSSLAPIFYGALQHVGLSRAEETVGYKSQLGSSWTLAVVGVGLILFSLLFMLAATCGPSVRRQRRFEAQAAARETRHTSATVLSPGAARALEMQGMKGSLRAGQLNSTASNGPGGHGRGASQTGYVAVPPALRPPNGAARRAPSAVLMGPGELPPRLVELPTAPLVHSVAVRDPHWHAQAASGPMPVQQQTHVEPPASKHHRRRSSAASASSRRDSESATAAFPLGQTLDAAAVQLPTASAPPEAGDLDAWPAGAGPVSASASASSAEVPLAVVELGSRIPPSVPVQPRVVLPADSVNGGGVTGARSAAGGRVHAVNGGDPALPV